MLVEDVLRVEKHSLLAYLKIAELNLDRVLDAFAKEKNKQELIGEQKKIMLNEWRDKPLHRQYPSITN